MIGRKSIRQRLTSVFVFLALAPLVLVGLLLTWQVYEIQKNEAIKLQDEIVRRVINEISHLSAEVGDDFEALAQITGLVEKNREEQGAILAHIQALTFWQNKNVFSEISLLDANGQERAKESLSKVYMGSELLNRSTEEVFLIPLQQKKRFFGPVMKDKTSGANLIEAGVPLVDKWTGDVSVVLAMTIQLDKLFSPVHNDGISGQIDIFITDKRGVVVSHKDPSISLAEKLITVPVQGEIVTGFDGFRSVRSARFFELGSQGFYLVCDYHLYDAFHGVLKSLLIVGVFIVTFLGLSIATAYKTVSPIVKKIEELSGVAKAIAAGDLERKAVESGDDEMSILGHAMNAMTSQLVADIKRRRQAENALREARNQLELKVASRTEELSKLNMQLYEKIEEKEMAESALIRAHEELEFRVETRTKELAFVNRTLISEIAEKKRLAEEHDVLQMKALTQNKLATLGEVATGVAHEMNQPLSYIKIIFEAAERDLKLGTIDHNVLLGECQESLKQLRRISTIIDHLRTFGRAEALSMSEVNLADVWRDTLIIFGERIRRRNINLVEDFEEDTLVSGNAVKLEQLFINLLHNSLDAMKADKSGEIQIHVKRENEMVAVAFFDTGVGMSEEVLAKIFEPFYTTKAVGQGTGLGLSISYGIVQEHNGTIECQSQEGQGAVFTMRFPCYVEEHGGEGEV
nr:HAMP domain-containing protein [Desulfobulbaceae bacterium]